MIQITFEQAQNLWLLAAIPVLAVAHFWFLRHAKRRALAFANFRALKRVTGESLITKNRLLLALRLCALLLAILAVSGATLWYEGQSSENDFVIAIDTSSSMTSQDVEPTRLDAAKSDASLFVKALQGESRVGVVTFAGVSLIQAVPTTDHAEVLSVIDAIEPLKVGGTDIPGVIITSTNLLLDSSRGRTIILITDGSNTIETFLDASLQRAVEYAKQHHVIIHAIGIGTNMGPIGYLPEYYNVSAVYNEDNLKMIANATGGTYSKAESSDQLLEAFKAVTSSSEKQLLRRSLGAELMMGALFILLVEWLLVNTRFRRVP